MKPDPSANVRGFLTDRLRSFGLVVAIGFLLLVSLAVSAALAALGGWLDRLTPGLSFVWHATNLIVSFGVISALFASLFRFLPDVKLQWRDVMAGALLPPAFSRLANTSSACISARAPRRLLMALRGR